jgi:protein RecA
MTIEERKKVIEARLKTIGVKSNKVLMGSEVGNKHKTFISTGHILIDEALGEIPGLAAGSVVEFVGESGSGKTHAALCHAAEHNKIGNRVAFLNIENSFYEPRARALGVKTQDYNLFELYENIGSGEKWGELLKALIESGDYGLIIVDSVTAMIPGADYDKDLGDEPKIGAHARMVGRLSQKALELCSNTGTIVIFINQFRFGAGLMKGSMQKKSTGGESIGYYAHTRLVFSKINGVAGTLFNAAKEVCGGKSQVYVLKNRFGPPNRKVQISIYFSLDESDPMVEFLMKAKSKNAGEIVTETKRRGLKYITEDGEVVENVNPKEFIKTLMALPAPTVRVKGDLSTTVFEFICRKIKYSNEMVERLNKQLESPDVVPLELEEDNVILSELSQEELNEILG